MKIQDGEDVDVLRSPDKVKEYYLERGKLVKRFLKIHVLIILDFGVIFEFQFSKVSKIEKEYEEINSEFA